MLNINTRILSLFFFILVLNCISIYSQTKDKEPNILVYIHTEDNNTDFKDVISRTVTYELGNAGFNAISIENTTDLEILMETAEWMGAFFIIEGLYSIKEKSVSFDINCYSVWDRKTLISISNKNSLSISTDQFIERALEEIIPVIQDNLYIVEQIILAADLEENPDSVIENMLDQKDSDQTDSEKETVSVEESEQRQEIEEAPEKTVVLPSHGPYVLEFGLAPFITTGEATKYFTLGIDFSLFGGYLLDYSFGYLILGVMSLIDLYKSDGLLISSENILISAGPELRAGMNFNYSGSMFFRVSSGGTLFMINANNTGYRTLLIPYFSLGLGLNYYFIKNFAFYFVSNYNIYMEQSTPVSGFLPTIGVSFRF